MSDMIERVAKVLCDDTLKRWRTPLGVQSEPWREFIPDARAAIEAMREPTEAMLDAVDAIGRDYFGGETAEFYTTMIDAALSPPTVVPGERK